jgi:D-alanine-D-alanine ligase
MKKLRILALVHEQLVPPDTLVGHSEKDINVWKTEFDVIHHLRTLGVQYELVPIRDAVELWKPHIVFNLLEEFHGEVLFDQNVVSFLELLKVPYTGCNPRGMIISRGKALSKKLLAYHRIKVPDFAVFPIGRKVKRSPRLAFPLIVKSLIEHASVGIARASVVDSDEKLAERVRFVHEKIGTDAIAEQFIEGREIYVSIMGNERLTTFPAWELVAEKRTDDEPLIATARVKHDIEYQQRHGIDIRAAELTPEQHAHLIHVSKRIFKTLELSGYARIDFRLGSDGHFYFLEANPNPEIAEREEFASAARAAGVEYPDLLQRIVSLGLPKWVGALVLAAVVIVAPTRAAAQETTPVAANEPLRVFLDCRQPGCDGNFFIDEMPYVRFTRDRMDAEAYLLVTGLGTGAGGIQYTVNVTGQGPFVGRSDTLVSSVPPNSTADQRRRELLRIFRLGLVRYLTATSFASRLSLTYVAPTTGEPSPTAVTNDPWDAWIYRVSANGNFGGESQSRNSRFNGSLSARRITNDWKFTAGASSSYRASRYTFTDGTNTSYTLRTYSTAFRLVRSLTSHWSAGVASEAGSTDFANQKLFVRANLSAEYNFFPWADATSNQVVAIYSLGVQHYRYVEQTIYFLDQETRPSHQVVLAACKRACRSICTTARSKTCPSVARPTSVCRVASRSTSRPTLRRCAISSTSRPVRSHAMKSSPSSGRCRPAISTTSFLVSRTRSARSTTPS